MAGPAQYICTLCNKAFSVADGQSARCPSCLRVTGVVGVEAKPISGRRSYLRLPDGRFFAWGAGCLLLAALLALAAWFFLDLSAGSQYEVLGKSLAKDGHPTPWDGWEELEKTIPPGARSRTGQQALDELADMLSARDGLVGFEGVDPPEQIRNARELHALDSGAVTPIEATAYLLAASFHTKLKPVPCRTRTDRPEQPFWDRMYALCLQDGGALTAAAAPLHETPELAELEPMEPGEFAAHFLAAMADRETTPAAAYRLFAAARELYDEPDIQFRLGMAKIENNALEFGVDDLRAALGRGAAPKGYLVMGATLLKAGGPTEAMEAFNLAAKALPDPSEALVGRARCLIMLERTEDAGKLLEELAKTAPTAPKLQGTLSLYYSRTGRLEEAIAAMEAEIAFDPATHHIIRLAELQRQTGQVDKAQGTLEKAYEHSREPTLAIHLIHQQADADQIRPALETASRALADHPDNLELLFLHGLTLLLNGNYAKAEEQLSVFTSKQPNNSNGWAHLAASRILLEKDGSSGKTTAAETVAYVRKHFFRQFFQIAVQLSTLGFRREAEELLERQRVLEPEVPLVATWLYYFYRLHERHDMAEALKAGANTAYKGEQLDWIVETFDRVDDYVENIKDRHGAQNNGREGDGGNK